MKECTNENQAIHSAISMSLMSVMEETHAESGEVLLMDVHSDSCIQYAGFKKRTMGGFVEIDSFLPPAAPVILLPAIYLIIMEHGGLPTDIISTGTEKFSLREILSTASEKKINKSISQYVLNGAQGLNYYLTQMGAWWHTSDRYSYQEFKLIQLKPFQMLSWMNVIARGESFIQSYLEDVVDKKIIIHSKNTKLLQKELELKDIVDANTGKQFVSISGITLVTEAEKTWARGRSILFCGYFPSENPLYSVYVRLNRKEQLDDMIHKEWPELGAYATWACRRIAETFKQQHII